MQLSPDQQVFFQIGPFAINATIAYTWAVMVLLVGGSWLVTRDLERDPRRVSRAQSALESVVSLMQQQIRASVGEAPGPFLPYIGTLFLYISISNLLAPVPIYEPPTGSLSTTAALALTVFLAVPAFGIARRGFRGYLLNYVEPTPLMAPFHVISEISRTVALAVRLFGNVMSGTLIAGLLLSVVPFIVPVAVQALELLIGQIQAYIFAVLATVYIASAIRSRAETEAETEGDESHE